MINFFSKEVSNIHAAALILGAAGFLSKFLGVLRDRLLAAHFGAGRELDIYYMAFQIPDFMAVIFLLGAGSAAIVPVLQDRLAKNPQSARALIARLSLFFFAASSALIFFAMFFLPALMRAAAPGFSGEEIDLAVKISRIMLFSPLLLGLSSIFSSVTQIFRRFFAYASAPIAYNLGIIAGIIAFVPFFGVLGLGGGVVLGAFLHFFMQFVAARKLGFSFLSREAFAENMPGWFNDPAIRRVLMLSFPRVIALSFSQITVFFMVSLGSMLAAGSIAVFNLAYNLYFVPIGIFGVSYSVALFPRLAESALRKNGEKFFEELFLGIRTILFWVLPSAALFIVLRSHIVRLAFGAGLFSWEDTRLTAASLAIFALAMGAGSISLLLIRAFYALERTFLPLIVDVLTFAVTLVSAYTITNLVLQDGNMLREFLRIGDVAHGEVVGLAAGFAIGILFNAVTLAVVLSQTARKEFDYTAVFPYGAVIKIACASLLAGIAAYAARYSFADVLELDRFVAVLAQGFFAGLCGVAAYIFSLYGMRSEDLLGFAKNIRKNLFRLGVLPKNWEGDLRS